jgi:prepilin-type N-terminal cleavage/methylation domain-containing protein
MTNMSRPAQAPPTPPCQGGENKGPRGFTLVETTVALALLVICCGGAWLVLGSANHSQRVLWDDLVASELAVSALEQVLSRDSLALTPPAGRAIELQPAGKPEALPNLSVTLHVTAVADQPEMREVRAVVEWRENARAPAQKIERTLRRRNP